ncbi:hypothetical protein [Halorarum halobium]|uniref:hypothetical protein n=1 Tax=Halorarum halobium TaxID=3075121 RepID=UPI0028A79AE3|nr:hypothetical protein [Halobaculum sp. XH14]
MDDRARRLLTLVAFLVPAALTYQGFPRVLLFPLAHGLVWAIAANGLIRQWDAWGTGHDGPTIPGWLFVYVVLLNLSAGAALRLGDALGLGSLPTGLLAAFVFGVAVAGAVAGLGIAGESGSTDASTPVDGAGGSTSSDR